MRICYRRRAFARVSPYFAAAPPMRQEAINMNKRDMPGFIVALVGLLIIIVSAGADIFHIGKFLGFGRFQILGTAFGIMTILAGVLLIPTFRQKLSSRNDGVGLLVFGGIILLVSFFADLLGVGTYPKFGLIQIASTLLGGGAMVFGVMQLRSKKLPEPENREKT